MLAVNKRGAIPTLRSAKVCACLFAGGIAELYFKKIISKDENCEFVSNSNFDENDIHLFPLYEVIKTANKPMSMQELVRSYYESCSGNKPTQLEASIKDMLVSRNAKMEIKAGFLRNKTNLVPKPEKIQAIISKIHTQLFGAEHLTTDTICLVDLLLKSTVANRHFSNDDVARLRIRLEELNASGTYAFETQLIDCAFDTASSFLEKMTWGDEEDDDFLAAVIMLTMM
ncbi:MAG: hypothetical protein LBE91_19715 [Tannerella sp.]|nr:hypothetical protein [Tannerella sp.]